MQIANRDILPSAATVEQYEDIRPLLVNDVIDTKFKYHDKIATASKKSYHRFGQLAIILVAISAIVTITEALLLPQLFQNYTLAVIAGIMAGSGVLLQAYITFTKQKTKWLLNRFASEYIRSLKFQSFALASHAKDSEDLAQKLHAFSAKKLNRLDNDLNTGLAILREFSPQKTLDTDGPVRSQLIQNEALTRTALNAFQELRIGYQRNFAASEIEKFKRRRRLFNSSQDMIYLGAAAFVFLSLITKIFPQLDLFLSTQLIDFMAVTLFVLGATEAIMDNALLEEQSQSRYEQYVADLDEAITHHPTHPKHLTDIVTDIEKVCLGELNLFCQAAQRISYRF